MAVKAPAAPQPPPQQQPTYAFREGFKSPLNPNVVAARLEYLRNTLGHSPTPKEVLEDARPVGSVLHEHFEWDNDVAAEQFRQRQAGELIVAVRLTVILHDKTKRLMPAFIRHTDDSGHRGFVTVQVALAPPAREQTLSDIIRRYWMTVSRDRSLGFTELEPLFDHLDALHDAYCK